MSAEKDLKALELRRAGVPVPKIMDICGFRTRKSALAAVDRAMRAQGVPSDPLALRALELDRLDRLHFSVWKKAVGGDTAAVDRVLSIVEMRLRVAGIMEAGLTPLTESFDKTMDLLDLDDVDQALVALGRRYCEQIDAASGLGDPLAVTKALHLMPHVVNILRELGATPAARTAVTGSAPAAGGTTTPAAPISLAAMRQQVAGG